MCWTCEDECTHCIYDYTPIAYDENGDEVWEKVVTYLCLWCEDLSGVQPGENPCAQIWGDQEDAWYYDGASPTFGINSDYQHV